jgi:hypothetical protein
MPALCLVLLVGTSGAAAQEGSAVGLRPVEDPLFGVSSMTPESVSKVVEWVTRQAGAADRG